MLQVILNWFFPRKCVVCGQALKDSDVCKTCIEKIPIFGWIFCAHCGRRLQDYDTLCVARYHQTPLESIGSAADYHRNDIRVMLHAYKYRRRKGIANHLAEMLVCHAHLSGIDKYLANHSAIVTEIPLTRRKKRHRGFNQSALLAKIFAAKLDIPYRPDVLARVQDRLPQVKMPDAKSRHKNIARVFQTAKPSDIKNHTILLIDDVVSSGATLKEAAKTLKMSGAKSVRAITVARGR